jgi:hypothetical protein
MFRLDLSTRSRLPYHRKIHLIFVVIMNSRLWCGIRFPCLVSRNSGVSRDRKEGVWDLLRVVKRKGIAQEISTNTGEIDMNVAIV